MIISTEVEGTSCNFQLGYQGTGDSRSVSAVAVNRDMTAFPISPVSNPRANVIVLGSVFKINLENIDDQ